MKKINIIIIIVIGIALALGITLFALMHFGSPEIQSQIIDTFYKNVTEITHDSITVKLKDGHNYDLSGKKYELCPYCDCCEEGMCDWHCEASGDSSCGCFNSSLSLFDVAIFTFPETIPIDEVYHDSIHFNKEDIFPVYVHIAKKLTDKESLTDKEVLEIANYFKKLSESINIYQQADDEFIDGLPEMPELYGDMSSDIQMLLYNRKIIVDLSFINEDTTHLFIENCLRMTGACPLDQLSVVCIEDSPESLSYYAFSDKGYCYFNLSISFDNTYWSSCSSFSPTLTPLFTEQQISKMLEMAVNITDASSEIPTYIAD